MTDTKTKVCPTCQDPFPPRRSDQRWCSEQCKRAARRMAALPSRRCDACSVSFEPSRRAQRWCSKPCKDKGAGPRRLSPEARERQRLYWQAKCRRRRAAKRGGASEPYTLAEIAARDRGRCGLCRGQVAMTKAVPHPKAPTIDHLVPVSESGDDTRANVQLACFRCNSAKGARGSQQLALIG